MNWFTNKSMGDRSLAEKEHEVDQWGGCKHVEEDASLLHIVQYENDSFGREGYCLCESCHDKMIEAQNEELVICHDCHNEVKEGDTIAWKPYDFYAPQGDEPLIICKECKDKPTHQGRVIKDSNDYHEEMSDFE